MYKTNERKSDGLRFTTPSTVGWSWTDAMTIRGKECGLDLGKYIYRTTERFLTLFITERKKIFNVTEP